MPLCSLEYTSNLSLTQEHICVFFSQLHQSMVTTIATTLGSCKSSATISNTYCVGLDTLNKEGFILLNIQILPVRTLEQIAVLKRTSGDLLQQLLEEASCNTPAQVRVLITEVNRALYLMEDYSPKRA